MASVLAVCVSDQKGVRKKPVKLIDILKQGGIIGDAHGEDPQRRISLLGNESVEKLRDKIPELTAGDFGENILTEGITLYELPIGTRLKIGEVDLEITKIGKECHLGCAIKQLTGDCVMPREGVFAEVITEGIIRPNDSIEIIDYLITFQGENT